jgi:POT family proton-dependent oligopeptide transporter
MSADADSLATPKDQASHPPGLYVLFATEMWERFSFYTMGAMFTLYLRDSQQNGGFGWTKAEATTLYSYYSMFVYASPLVGGYLASWKLGFRNAVMIGGLFFIMGHLLLSFHDIWIVYAALACLVIGNGFFKPNISAMVGALYPAGSPLKERAYNFFYMGINVGAFLAPVTAEIVKTRFGYHPAFAVAAAGMVISVLILWWFKHHVEDPKKDVDKTAVAPGEPPLVIEKKHPIDSVPDWQRIAALIVVFLIVIVFWMVFHQNHTTILYWGADNTDWETLRTITSPLRDKPVDDARAAASLVAMNAMTPGLPTIGAIKGATDPWQPSGIITNAINPLWVIALTFPLVAFWRWLNRNGWEPSTPTKMALGMVTTGLAFLVLYGAALVGEEKASDTLRHGFVVSDLWLIGAFAVLTLAELMLSPMGLALVAKVSPPRYLGIMMGLWFVATAIGNKLTVIGVYWDDWTHSTFWLVLAGLSFAMSIVLILLLQPLKRAMPGV